MPELLDVSTDPTKPAQTIAPGTEPSSWMPLSDEQRSTAPEVIKNLLTDKKWTSFDDVVNGYVDLEKVLGRGEHIFKPESSDDTEGWAKYWGQLGVPDIDGYEFEADEAVPFAEDLLKRFKEFAHKQHYTKEQAAGAVQFQREIIKEAMAIEAAQAQETTEAEEADKEIVRKALKQKWGGEVAYQNKLVDARRIADELGIYQILEKKGLASDPDIISMLDTIRERTAEGVITPGTPPVPTKSPLEELEEIKKSEAFLKKFHPKHKETMIRFMQLNQEIANKGLGPKRVRGG